MRKPASLRIALADSLRKEDEAIQSSANLLSLLFRRINEDLTIDAKGWSRLLERYLSNELTVHRIPQNSRGRSSERSNLTKGLSAPGMTLQNFMRGLQVINPHFVEWSFTLTFADREVTTVVELDRTALFQDYHNVKYPGRLNPLALAWRDLRKKCIPLSDKKLWRERFNQYLADPENGVIRTDDSTPGARNSERGNLTKALENPDMSIKVFTKGIRIINPQSIRTTIKLMMRPGGRVTEHSLLVITNQLSMLETLDEETHGEQSG